MTDPIADLLTRIRNAGLRRIEVVNAPHSKVLEEIVKILKDENFITDYSVDEKKNDRGTTLKDLNIKLRYNGSDFVIQNLKRISKPGIRTYISYTKVPKVLGGLGISIVSTPKGIMTGKRAKELKIGGELICTIY